MVINEKISVVVPVYGAPLLLEELVERLSASIEKLTTEYELILVDDNCPKNSWAIIERLVKEKKNILGIKLSRNFGQQNAMSAGFHHATGDWVLTMDCDLQDEPEQIYKLLEKAKEGYDVVFASRQNRKDSYIKKMSSVVFNKILTYLSDVKQDHTVANFVLYKKKVVDAMLNMGDYYIFHPMLNKWVGFNQTKVEIEHAERKDNQHSSYTYRKKIKLAVTTIVSFSDKPLRLVLNFGLLLVFTFFILACYLVAQYFINDRSVSGWLSVFLSIWLLSGIIIIILGLIGLYIGKMFETVKNRPKFIVSEIINS